MLGRSTAIGVSLSHSSFLRLVFIDMNKKKFLDMITDCIATI